MLNNEILVNQLFDAIRENDIPRVKQLIEKTGCDHLDKTGRTPLFLATELRNTEIASLLLSKGANIDFQDPEKKLMERTPFLLAGSAGYDEMLEIFIDYNPDVSILNYYGGNALIPAAHHGHLSTVRFLLENTKVDVNHINRLGWTALLEAIILADGGETHQNIVKELLKHGADPNIADKDGKTAIQHARERNYKEIVSILQQSIESNLCEFS